MMYDCLDKRYNWDIIFGSGCDYSKRAQNTLELENVSKSLDGTYLLNPICPSVQTWSGGGDPNWPKERERIINENKIRMAQNAMSNGVRKWCDNALNYLKKQDIVEDYKLQFPEIYNFILNNYIVI